MRTKIRILLLFIVMCGFAAGTFLLMGTRSGDSAAEAPVLPQQVMLDEERTFESMEQPESGSSSSEPEDALEQPGDGKAPAEDETMETGSGGGEPKSESVATEPPSPPVDDVEQKVESTLASMTLEEKAAQLFFVTPEALTGYAVVTAAGDATRGALGQYPVGGIVYFERNLLNPEQTAQMLENVQRYAEEDMGIPLFLGVDEEGGRVLRVGRVASFGVERIEAMGKLAESGDERVIYQAGDTIGAYLAELGFNVDFAPDADVLVDVQNQAIGDRSFGTDPDGVASMAWAFAEGLHRNGILAAYKHFPGHGGTKEDSHTGYAYVHKTLEELRQMELIPFQDGCDRGVDFIMVSHISAPEITGDDTPAALSGILVENLLREEMEYEGIIITDAMSMGAITLHYSAEEATLLAIEAGCDMILMPESFQLAYAAVIKAVSEGRISEERIDESVRRILRVKMGMVFSGESTERQDSFGEAAVRPAAEQRGMATKPESPAKDSSLV